MSTKPILFSTPMVKAILEGRKTQTRRVVKPQPDSDDPCIGYVDCECYQTVHGNESEIWYQTEDGDHAKSRINRGDVLWVRETWQKGYKENIPCNSSRELCTKCFRRGDCTEMESHPYEYLYKASPNTFALYEPDDGDIKWKPSIHMPREAARLFLKVKSVRVERLQDISVEDCIAEGVEPLSVNAGLIPDNYRKPYEYLWDRLNAKRGYSWESNPWVWVIEFERVGHDKN